MVQILTTTALVGLLNTLCGPTQTLEIGARPASVRFGTPGAGRHDGAALGALRAEVIGQLPPGWRLGGLRFVEPVPRRPAGSPGALGAHTTLPTALSAGANRVEVELSAGPATWARLAAEVTLWPAPGAGGSRPAPVLARNQEVLVVVRNGNVTVQTKGVTQRAAGLGERVAVLPHGSTHTVQGTVTDPKTVEVAL